MGLFRPASRVTTLFGRIFNLQLFLYLPKHFNFPLPRIEERLMLFLFD
jgi:hypothetical protein